MKLKMGPQQVREIREDALQLKIFLRELGGSYYIRFLDFN